ncbi:MAG: tetratricopeptide repeat protein [Gemmatimonadota bacterium]
MTCTRRAGVSLLLFSGALLTIPTFPAHSEAQEGGRFRVMVANLKPTDGTRENFGADVSDRVRDILDLPTHVAMSERDTDQAARQYDLRASNLDCTTARQLADLLRVPLVFCGDYATEGGNIRFTGSFFTVPGGEEFSVTPDPLPERETRQAADQILAFFQETVDRLNQISYCFQDYNSGNWEGALQYCTRAVELAPESRQARTALARTYQELERFEEALEEFEVLLEADPYSSPNLEGAGYAALQLGENDKAFDYYSRYLELNPDNAQVRMQLAYQLAQAGNDEGAMELVRAGVEQNPDDVDIHEAYGTYAMRAAGARAALEPRPVGAGGPPQISPEVAELYRNALRSLEAVFEARGVETDIRHIHNLIRARIQLGEVENAIDFGRRAMELFAQDPQIQSLLASAYARNGDYAEAIQRMQRALELQPDLPNAHVQMAQWQLESGNLDGAIEEIRLANAATEQSPDQLGGILFSHGWTKEITEAGDLQDGVRLIVAAKNLEGITDAFRSQVNFFHGVALYQPIDRAMRESTSVEIAQRYLPVLRELRGYLVQGQAYAQQANQNVAQFIQGTDVWIETAEAVIARGSRGG